MSGDLNNFNLLAPFKTMGGIVALEGVYDLCNSLRKTNPAQKKMLQNHGIENLIGGLVVLFAAYKAPPLTINHIPTAIQPIVSKNVKILLGVGSFAMLAYGVEKIFKSFSERDERKSNQLCKSGLGLAIFGTGGILSLTNQSALQSI